jgi:SNF2 family DNA or RNA helicase
VNVRCRDTYRLAGQRRASTRLLTTAEIAAAVPDASQRGIRSIRRYKIPRTRISNRKPLGLRDVREGLAEYSIPLAIRDQLLDYQATAVQALGRRIVTRRGTMLGDVVGLGKTLTAIAVALMLREEHGYLPLVLCPKNLVSMWEEHLNAYDSRVRVHAG